MVVLIVTELCVITQTWCIPPQSRLGGDSEALVVRHLRGFQLAHNIEVYQLTGLIILG